VRLHVYGSLSILQTSSVQFGIRGLARRLDMWEALSMRLRGLRILSRIGAVPAVGVCTRCDQQFEVPAEQVFTAEHATENLQVQFDKHECSASDVSQNALRITKEINEQEL
jgi:hypothetical protein